MANSFLDYLADSDEEALGPVPPRKKLASTAPGASRGNALALPGIVATARSVTRAADRLEKDRTPQPRPGIFDAGAPGPVFGSDLTGQVDDMVRQQERAQPRAVPAADDGLTHGVDAESERALRMGERIASAAPSVAQPRFSRFPSAVVGDATRSMLPEVQPSAMVSPRDVATQQAQRLAQARRTADEADRQRVYDALPPQVRVPMNFYERAAQVLPGGQMLAALPQQIGRSLAGDDPFNLPQTEAEQAGIRRSTLDRAAGLAGTFAGYGGMLAAAEGGAGALLPESAGVGARKLVARGAQAAVDASQPAEDARQRAEHVLLGQAMSAAGDLPALARITRGEDAFQRSLIDRRIRSGLEAERAPSNVFGVEPGTTTLPGSSAQTVRAREEGPASGGRSLPQRVAATLRNETGATGNISALNTSVGEAIRRAPVDSAPRSQWTRYLDDEFDRWLTDGNEGSDIGKAHPDERLWAELDERMSQRFKSNQPVTRRDLLNLLAESETRGIEGGVRASLASAPAPRSLVDRLISPVRNETGAIGGDERVVQAAFRRAGEVYPSGIIHDFEGAVPEELWDIGGFESGFLTNHGRFVKPGEGAALHGFTPEPGNVATSEDLIPAAAALREGHFDSGAASLRPVTALAGAGLGAAGGAAADPEHPLKGAAEGALLGGIAGTAAPSLLARLARSGESADLPPLPRKGTIIQTWDGRPIEILGRGRRGQVRARWEGREVDLPWASVHKMTLPQPPRRAVPEITDPEIPDASPGAPAYTETGGLDALARGEDVGERPLLTMRHRYNPDYTATLHLEHAGGRPRFVVREHGGTSPRVLDFDTEEQATTAARTMGFATEGPTDAPLPGQSAEDFRNQIQASAVAGLRGDRPGGFRTRPPTPAGPAKGAPLPLPPLHPALDPEAVRPVWDTVSGRYPRLASLIRGIGVEARRGVGAGYDGPERALFLRADRDPALHFVFHELAHAAQYARGKLGEFRSDDVGLLTEMEDYAYRMGRAYDAAKGGNPPPGADPIDHLMYRMALGAVGGGVGGAAVDREHNRLASGLEGAAAGALLQGAGELVPSAVRAVSNRVGAVGDDITRAMRQEDLPRSLQGGIPRDLRTPPLQRAYLHGISAGESGLAHDFNNFPIGTPEWRAAERGWNATRPRERTVSERASSPVRNETGAAGAEAPRRFVAMPAERGQWRVIDSTDGSVAEEVGGIGAQRTAEALAKRYDVERGVVAQADSGPLAGSRVVDESGVPKVVYHGTSKGFGEFDPAQLDPDAQYGPGYYFTENPAVAGDVGLGGKAEFGYATPREGASEAAPNVRPARLGIRNPFDIDATYSPADLHTLLEDVGADPDGIVHALNFVTQDGRSTRRLTGDDFYEGLSEAFGGDRAAANAALRKAGYDGITHIGGGNTGTDPHRVWIAFDRPQIRSAFGPAETAAQTGSTGLAMMRATGGAGLGGLYGYATGDPDNEAGRTARALGFAAAGAGLALAPEALQSIRRVSGNDVGAVGDVGGMADPERALYDALNKRGRPPAPRDLAALASGEMEPDDFARTYGVSRRVAKNYAEHVRTLSDPEGYRSPLDSDEFTQSRVERSERQGFEYQPAPEPAPIDGVPDDGFLPSDAPPRKYGASGGQMGARVFQPGIANRVVGAAVAGTGGAAAGALLTPDDRAGGALRWGAAGAGLGALGLNPETIPMLRRSTMLMNAAGRIRDVVSNVGMGGSETSAELIGTGVDALLDYVPGMRGQRTMAFNPTAVAKAAYEGLTAGTADMGRAMVGKARLHRSHAAAAEAASASVEGAERVVMSNPVLDAAVRVTGRFAGSVDSQAAVFAYEKSIASQARTIALNERIGRRATRTEAAAMEARLRAEPTDEMKVLAASAVAHATFTNESVMSRMLADMREATFPNEAKGRPDLPWARAGLDFIAPFRRVPGAVAGKTLEYSPLGIAKMTRDAVRLYKLASAGADPALIAEARRSFAMTTGRVGTGATTIALGAALGEQGLMTGVHLTQAQKDDGARPFSIKIAGRWWPLGMMGPTGAMLAVGAELHNRGTGEAAAALGENVADATLMRGMGDVRAAVSNPDKAERYAASAAASFVPPIVGQVARIIDPVQRKPDGVLQTVEARIPFASRNVPARTDNFGREVRETASVPGRVALALFDGVHSVPSRGGRDAVQDRLTRMGVNVGSVRRKTAETEQEYAERISDYPEAPHREDETDADYRRRAATWSRPRPAETDAEFRQRQRDLGASVHANLSALFARRAPEDEYLNDKWTAYRGAEATVREAHPNLRGPAFQRAVEAERRKVVASLIAGTKHSFAVAGDEDPRTYLSP